MPPTLATKRVFILTNSGKPVFAASCNGNGSGNGGGKGDADANAEEDEEAALVPLFGLLQAMASVAQDVAGDELCSIEAGAHRVVYVLRGALYLVAVSSGGEPEAVLQRQLEFLHNQVLFVLTSKVHDVLRINAAKDIRELLGHDSIKLMHESCKDAVTPLCIAFAAVAGLVCAPDLREDVAAHLRRCVGRSGAALGLLLHGDTLVGYATSAALTLELATEDVVLLARFVGHAKSLHSHDQNWIPLCLPAFNARAYLQAYTSNLTFPISSGPSSPRSPGNSSAGAGAGASKQLHLSLVLIATSSDPLVFGELHDGRKALESEMQRTDVPQRLFIAVESQQAYLSTYAVPLGCTHFLHVHRPLLPPAAAAGPSKGRTATKSKKATATDAPPSPHTQPLPAQCHALCLDGSMISQADTDRWVPQHLAPVEMLAIWAECFVLFLSSVACCWQGGRRVHAPRTALALRVSPG